MHEDTRKAMAKLVEATERALGEPVLAAGVFSRPGSMANVAIMQVSPLVSMLRGFAGKRKAGGLPPNVVLAVTAHSAHAFAFKPSYGGVKVKAEVARWSRHELRVEGGSPGLLAQRVLLAIGDERIELDVNAGDRHGINRAVIELLRAGVPA